MTFDLQNMASRSTSEYFDSNFCVVIKLPVKRGEFSLGGLMSAYYAGDANSNPQYIRP